MADGRGIARDKRQWGLPKARLSVFIGVFLLVSTVLTGRLYEIVLNPSVHYSNMAQSESFTSFAIPAARGTITDSSGNPLALSVPRKSVVADPLLVTDPVVEANLLAGDLGLSDLSIRSTLLQPTQFAYIARLIPNSIAATVQGQIDAGKLNGVSLITEMKRVYPAGPLLSPVIGQTNAFGSGVSGLEYQYNSILSGRAGSEAMKVSVAGLALPDGVTQYQAPRAGDNIQLTIDSSLQYVTEHALAAQVQSTKAISGTAVVMDVKTGDILAMANIAAPTPKGQSNPANAAIPVGSPRALPEEAATNLAVTTVYEPGSVAKLATFTAALEKKVITPSTVLTVPDHMLIDGSLFHDAEVHPVEQLTPGQILGQSSNIGTIEVAKMLGKRTITASMQRFGWGLPTGLNFPGESQGFLDPLSRWSGTAIGSVPIGQDEALTPLQVLDAYNSVANGGIMTSPKLVKAISTPSGRTISPNYPKSKRIVSAPIAKTMRNLLENAVGAMGTAPSAAIPGYQVAGKTGTSQKPYPNRPGYQPGAFWATFVGFAPASHPVLSAIVMLDQPTQIYGGEVAAPVFSQIMSYALAKYHVTPSGAILSPTQIAALNAKSALKSAISSASKLASQQSKAPTFALSSARGVKQTGNTSPSTSPTTISMTRAVRLKVRSGR
ncbi:MAG: penicillin-binding protein 2 [Acidimicrobiaceae bacterium]|nr:penicillin-binding protein 2 [Acidimicrobiaceae bacterium]